MPLLETKVLDIDRKMMLDLWGRGSFDFVHKPAAGQAGGILVAWNKTVLEVVDSVIGDFLVSMKCRNKVDDGVWAFSGVYGPCDHELFGCFRDELGRVWNGWMVP